ncbi:MAG: ABC transporter permease [Anaerolineales bacterium]|nr:ABC transporter permease [Anaerolineales bacterium]
MTEYLVRRILQMIPLIFIISLLSFMIAELAPGDPVMMYLAPEKRGLSVEELDLLRHQLGLDRPVHIRYFSWMGNLFNGNWGYSLRTNDTVLDEIGSRLPNTLMLGGFSILISIVVAIPVGVLSALKRNSAIDYLVTFCAFIGISVPVFLLALGLIDVFSFRLGILPSVGMSSLKEDLVGMKKVFDTTRHLILPVITLSFSSIAYWSRYQRASLLELLNQDFVLTARSKGLKERVVIWRHVFKNSLLPLVTLAGLSIPSIVNGAYITESVFGWPGMGRLGIAAIIDRDYPIVMGVTLISSILVVAGNLIADICYAIVDPRISHK